MMNKNKVNAAILIALSFILPLSACNNTDIVNPEPKHETHAQLLQPVEPEEPTVVPTPDIIVPQDNPSEIVEGEESKDPVTVPVAYEYGSMLDGALFCNYDYDLYEVTKYEFFYVDDNLYFEETWGGMDEESGEEYVMSYFAGEIFVPEENDIEYENEVLTVNCIIKRYSTFSNAGEYWDNGKEAVITLNKDEIELSYADSDERGFVGKKSDTSTLYEEDITFEMLEEINPDIMYNTNMEFMNDWWCDEEDTHFYVQMKPNGTITFLTKTNGEPAELTVGVWGWDCYAETQYGFAMRMECLGRTLGTGMIPWERNNYICIDDSELYFLYVETDGTPSEKTSQIYQSKWVVTGRECPIDYWSIS